MAAQVISDREAREIALTCRYEMTAIVDAFIRTGEISSVLAGVARLAPGRLAAADPLRPLYAYIAEHGERPAVDGWSEDGGGLMAGYSITVTRPCPNCKRGDAEGECLCADAAEHHSADTLEEAEAIVRTEYENRDLAPPKFGMPRGTIGGYGPLPDGSTITVEPQEGGEA